MKKNPINELDSMVRYMIELNIPLTVENYVSLNFMGDQTRDTLEGEYLPEVERLIEDGLLVDTKSKRVN